MLRVTAIFFLIVKLSYANAVTLNPEPNLDLWTQGIIYAVAEDSQGRTYFAGTFTLFMGEPRSNLARVLADGSLDQDYRPLIDGPIYKINLLSDQKLLIAGDFTNIDSISQPNIAKIQTDGALDTTWSPAVNDSIFAMTLGQQNDVLIGGDFTQVNGASRGRAAKISLVDGSADDNWDIDVNQRVLALQIDQDSGVWIGGAFSEINGVIAERLAFIEPINNQVENFSADSNINHLSQGQDGFVYVCGQFSSIGGVERLALARFDLDRSLDLSWAPRLNGRAIGCHAGPSGFFVAGVFSEANGITLGGVAKFDLNDGSLDMGFTPEFTGVATGQEGAFSINTVIRQFKSSEVIVGGFYRYVDGLPASSGSVLDLESGNLISAFDAERAAIVRAIADLDSSGWLIGGQFRRAGSDLRDNVLLLDVDGRVDPNWLLGTNSDVYAIEINDGAVYLGGVFNTVDGNERRGMGKIDLTETGPELNTNWSPSFSGSASVYTLELDVQRPGYIYAGGSFIVDGPGSYTANDFARFSTDLNGEVDVALEDVNTDGLVLSMAQSANGALFLGGSFASVRGNNLRGLVEFENNTELTLTEFDAGLNSNVLSLAIDGGESLYVVGQFTRASNSDRVGAAKFTNGLLENWAPTIARGTAVSVTADEFDGVYLGGNFQEVNGLERSIFARVFSSGIGQVDQEFNIEARGDLMWTSFIGKGEIFVGGAFDLIKGESRLALARLGYRNTLPDEVFSDRFESFVSARSSSFSSGVSEQGIQFYPTDFYLFPFDTKIKEHCFPGCPEF